MGLFDAGFEVGVASGPSRGRELRDSKIKATLDGMDDQIEAGLETIDTAKENDRKKERLKDQLMKKLKTTNQGLVLSHIEDYYDFDMLNKNSTALEIKPEDVTKIRNNIVYAQSTFSEQGGRAYTTLDYSKIKNIQPNRSNLIKKATGGGPTSYEAIELYAKSRGMTFEDARDALAIEGSTTGIPGGPPNPKALRVTGRTGSGPEAETQFNVERDLSDVAFSYDLYDAQGNISGKGTAFESSGKRTYDIQIDTGRLNNLNTIEKQIDKNIINSFGVYGAVDPITQNLMPGEPGSKEELSYKAMVHVGRDVKAVANQLYSNYGEISASTIQALTDEAYENFFKLFEGEHMNTKMTRLETYNDITQNTKSNVQNEVYKNIPTATARKEQFFKDLETDIGRDNMNTFKLFAEDVADATDDDQKITRGSPISAFRKPSDITTRIPTIVMNQPDGKVRVYFNDGSSQTGTKQEMAIYL